MNFTPVPAREHAIVWEIRPEEARGALFDFGMEQRIVLNRTWRALRGAPLPSFLKLKQFRKVPVIVSLHPSLARTFILPFRLTRKKNEAPLQPENLQSMLTEFLAKTTFEMRRLAGEALGVEELDAILLDAHLTRLLADGVEARDDRPIAGRKIEGFLQVILTTRAVFHDLHDLLHSGREIFFTERGPAAMTFLGRHFTGPLTFLDLGPEGGWLFRVDRDAEEIIEKTRFNWNAEDLPLAFAEAWGISKRTAEKVYDMFLKGGFSGRAAHFAAKLIEPVEESFNKTFLKTKAEGIVYLRSIVPLSLDLPALVGAAKIVKLPLEEMLRESGLTWESKAKDDAPFSDDAVFLTSFLDYYYHRGDPRGHKMLTRHIHWISA